MAFSSRAFFQSAFLPKASGFQSVHPKMEQALRGIGIEDRHISQGWGYAKASSGYHSPVGWVDGHRYSTCVDLRTTIGCNADMKSRLVAAGFAPFFRLGGSWKKNDNEHVHCVYVGDLPLLPGPHQQAEDYARGLNGLVGHDLMTGPLSPSEEERAVVSTALETHVPHVAVSVLDPKGNSIRCYAYLERVRWSGLDKVRCEVRPFVQYWGGVILDQKTFSYKGKTIQLSPASPRLSGNFLRANVAELARMLGLRVSDFSFRDNNSRATLKLSY
jgi:hypothetical protein